MSGLGYNWLVILGLHVQKVLVNVIGGVQVIYDYQTHHTFKYDVINNQNFSVSV